VIDFESTAYLQLQWIGTVSLALYPSIRNTILNATAQCSLQYIAYPAPLLLSNSIV